jgi:hypothetical protein
VNTETFGEMNGNWIELWVGKYHHIGTYVWAKKSVFNGYC